jgi:peptidoglycan/LPS O-acetylase OafA/YrhL
MRTSVPLSNYKPQLDGLRAIAVMFVFLHHWTQLGFDLGIIGVQLFFVLSGFLITGILLDLRQSVDSGSQTVGFSLRHFYVRRFLRILPLYYFCLLFFVCLDRFSIRETIVWHSLFLSNVLFFLQGEFHGPFSHFWTLAVEEQFYIFWPWVVLLLPLRFLPRVLVLLIVLSLVVRAALFFGGHVRFAQHSTLVFANFDTLGLGALAGCFARA